MSHLGYQVFVPKSPAPNMLPLPPGPPPLEVFGGPPVDPFVFVPETHPLCRQVVRLRTYYLV